MNAQTLIQWLIIAALVVAAALMASGLAIIRRQTREKGVRLGDVIIFNIRGRERRLLIGSVITLLAVVPALLITYAVLIS